MGSFDPLAVVNALAWTSGESLVYVGGQGGGSGVEGRQLHNSTNNGWSFSEDNRPPGAINSMARGNGGLMVGSWWQKQQDSGNPDASFAQFRYDGSPVWLASRVVGFAENLKTITINERGTFFFNGTFYLVGIALYEILPPNPIDPATWSQCVLGKSYDNGASWEWNVFDAELVPENKGVYEVAFVDDLRGIAIGGNHYQDPENDYLAYILTTRDGGRTWTKQFENQNLFTFTDINCVGTTCWVSGLGLGINAEGHIGLVWVSYDIGETWRPQLTITDTATSYAHLWHVHFINSQIGFAQGDYWAGLIVIYVTEDGGNTWKIAFDPNCQERYYVHDVYDVSGTFHMLLQEFGAEQPLTGIVRLDWPAKSLPALADK